MELKLIKKSDLANNEQDSPETDEKTARTKVLESAKSFKSSWKNLAQSLYTVWKERFHTKWGYETFDEYTNKEVNIKQQTAKKLINSYSFLKKEEPTYLQKTNTDSGQAKEVPSFDAVNVLQRAKKNLNEQDYSSVKKDVLEDKKDIKEVKKELTSLIRQRKDIDPEAQRKRQNNDIVKRFLTTLKSLNKDIATLKLLPGSIVEEISELVCKIEAEMS